MTKEEKLYEDETGKNVEKMLIYEQKMLAIAELLRYTMYGPRTGGGFLRETLVKKITTWIRENSADFLC